MITTSTFPSIIKVIRKLLPPGRTYMTNKNGNSNQAQCGGSVSFDTEEEVIEKIETAWMERNGTICVSITSYYGESALGDGWDDASPDDPRHQALQKEYGLNKPGDRCSRKIVSRYSFSPALANRTAFMEKMQ